MGMDSCTTCGQILGCGCSMCVTAHEGVCEGAFYPVPVWAMHNRTTVDASASGSMITLEPRGAASLALFASSGTGPNSERIELVMDSELVEWLLIELVKRKVAWDD